MNWALQEQSRAPPGDPVVLSVPLPQLPECPLEQKKKRAVKRGKQGARGRDRCSIQMPCVIETEKYEG